LQLRKEPRLTKLVEWFMILLAYGSEMGTKYENNMGKKHPRELAGRKKKTLFVKGRS